MSTVTFDKLAYLETLKASGVPDDQARAHASALDAALHDSVVTKADLRSELEPVRLDIVAIKAELAIVKWMVGGIGFGMLLLVLKSFVPGVGH
ncbi:MAG: hypothetical protein H7840_06165 [Alphaproteobacteria bacterium]